MAHKTFALTERQQITVYKRRSSRSLRMTITPKGQVRVSIPSWTPYAAGVQFARSRLAWIAAHTPQQKALLQTDQAIGKAHHLRFIADAKTNRTRGRVLATEVTVTHPVAVMSSDAAVQLIAEQASIRALRRQAEELLPQRVAILASKHGLDYNTVSVKRMTSRWGSCDQQHNIVLNLFLMQLPWDLIDYVLVHELAHTQVLRHGSDFWELMERLLPDCRALRRRMREHQPVLDSPAPTAVA